MSRVIINFLHFVVHSSNEKPKWVKLIRLWQDTRWSSVGCFGCHEEGAHWERAEWSEGQCRRKTLLASLFFGGGGGGTPSQYFRFPLEHQEIKSLAPQFYSFDTKTSILTETSVRVCLRVPPNPSSSWIVEMSWLEARQLHFSVSHSTRQSSTGRVGFSQMVKKKKIPW